MESRYFMGLYGYGKVVRDCFWVVRTEVIRAAAEAFPSKKVDRELLVRVAIRLSYMEGSRALRNKRRNLQKTLDHILDLKDELARASSTPISPHWRTIQELQASAEWISDDLTWWNKGRTKGRAKRGIDPRTPVLMALMAYVKDATGGEPCFRELGDLVSMAYTALGSNRQCSEESLKMLWKRNSGLRKNWKAVLGLAPGPTSRHKTHAPSRRRGPLGSGITAGFIPPSGQTPPILGTANK